MHKNGKCTVNAAVRPEEGMQNICVATQVGNIPGTDIAAAIVRAIEKEQLLYVTEVDVDDSVLAMPKGRQPKS